MGIQGYSLIKKNSDITGISADFVRRIIEVVLAINVDRQ
jgi:hypothetical protein